MAGNAEIYESLKQSHTYSRTAKFPFKALRTRINNERQRLNNDVGHK